MIIATMHSKSEIWRIWSLKMPNEEGSADRRLGSRIISRRIIYITGPGQIFTLPPSSVNTTSHISLSRYKLYFGFSKKSFADMPKNSSNSHLTRQPDKRMKRTKIACTECRRRKVSATSLPTVTKVAKTSTDKVQAR